MEKHLESMESPLETFIGKFQTLSGQERQKKKSVDERNQTITYNPDLANIINPRTLNETDMMLWKEIEDETITLDTFQQYVNALRKELETVDDTETHQSRLAFRAYAGNKAMPIIGLREMEELKPKGKL